MDLSPDLFESLVKQSKADKEEAPKRAEEKQRKWEALEEMAHKNSPSKIGDNYKSKSFQELIEAEDTEMTEAIDFVPDFIESASASNASLVRKKSILPIDDKTIQALSRHNSLELLQPPKDEGE